MSTKAEKTRRHIVDVFMKLLNEFGFEKITVASIAKEAEINRGTFYLHFTDKYAVLEEVQEEIYRNFEEIVTKYIGVSLIEKQLDESATLEELFRVACLQLMKFLYEQKEVAQIFLGVNGDSQFIERLEKVYTDVVKGKIKKKISVLEDFQLEFVFAGAIAIVKKWIREGAMQPPEEMARLLAECMTSSPIEIFERIEVVE
ncbi:TetR/AcrR family transcriptional regulator [uncultured Enterococcus sp.]|uniref:TetR/AcrR family transcriptional regulator n=1 Tax=uncultured Enterococcus sp. TaxID=167972 RepID=UPI002AA8D6F2|nr:TetR/AcrR family transcriptional regulator [uncultured Enterococcus sp.]